jgi:hypothetical protein
MFKQSSHDLDWQGNTDLPLSPLILLVSTGAGAVCFASS